MHHKVSRGALVALLTAVSLLAIPAVASAHFRSFNYFMNGPSGGSHNLTCDEAKWIGVSHMGNFHGGVARVGDCLSFASGWPTWERASFGWRANDGSLMRTTVQEDYCFCNPMQYHQSDSHQS